jgi:hypothetical protein
VSVSKHFGARQLAAIDKIGDQMIQGDEELPGFSASGCVSSVDRVLDYMPASDLADLKLLLTLMSFLPASAVGWFLGFLERGCDGDGEPWATLRLIRIGLRGLIMTLYFASPTVNEKIGYRVGVYTGDLD